MRLNSGTYEYIAVYVDGLLIAAKDPLAITKCLEETHLFKLKGAGPLKYFRDEVGTLCFGPRKYIEKIWINMNSYLEQNLRNTHRH
jgi:hypothetical protein